MTTVRGLPLIAGQCAMIVAVLAVLAFWPPRHGAMLLLALDGGDMSRSILLARESGAALLARGPLPGSIVVLGDRRMLAPLLAGTGIVMLAAPSALCGSAKGKRS